MPVNKRNIEVLEKDPQYKELLLSEERLKMVLEGSDQGFWDWNIETGVVKRNTRWAQMLGYSTIQEFEDNTDSWTNSIYPDDRDAAWESINNHLEGVTDCHKLEYRMLTKDGGYKWVLDNAKIVQRDAQGRPLRMCGTHTDITERKNTEAEQIRLREKLYQAQKLESLGQLSAGIAHEINTPCQYINDNTSYLADAIAKMEPFLREAPKLLEIAQKSGSQTETNELERILKLYEDADIEFLLEEATSAIDQSQSGMEKIKRIVVAMKEFAHPVDEGVLEDINRALANTLIVARKSWKNIAELVTDYDEALPRVYCVPSAVNQVFLNIIVNATHAIAEVVNDGELGKLTVSTSTEDDQAVIKIADTGPGITEDVRKKIFDPFFTTKEIGIGTGHGLAISHKIICEDHKGSIEIESTPGEGSCFIIRLPINQAVKDNEVP